nr:MAG TPA: hypothetical protein [Caudoviricetes sp.]
MFLSLAASLRFSSLSSKNTLDCMYFKSLYPLALTTTITPFPAALYQLREREATKGEQHYERSGKKSHAP